MATWREIATESFGSAGLLLQDQRWRSTVSRAYYAVYGRVAEALTDCGMTMPKGREGPSHGGLPEMIVDHLKDLKDGRWRLSSLVGTLYRLRLNADYYPSLLVDDSQARSAVRIMREVFRIMKGGI